MSRLIVCDHLKLTVVFYSRTFINISLLISLILFASCESAKFSDDQVFPALNYVTPPHWTNVLSVGQKQDINGSPVTEYGYVANMCQGTTDCVALGWTPFVEVEKGVAEGYAIYRKQKDSSAPFVRLGIVSTNAFADTDNLTPGFTYVYRVYPIFDQGRVFINKIYMNEIEVLKPPANLAFVHRSMINLYTCQDMLRPVGVTNGSDPDRNFRCRFSGLGSRLIDGVSYYDFGKHLLVDRFETGCNFSRTLCSAHDPGDASSTTDCIGASNPNTLGVTGPINSVFSVRGRPSCYINTDGAGTWIEFANASLSQRQFMASNAANLGPILRVSAPSVQGLCASRTLSLPNGQNLNFNISRRSDFLAYTHWDKNLLLDADINLLEAGSNTQGYCNTDSGHGIPWTSAYPGTDPELLGGSTSSRIFTAGSEKSSNCVSAFGVQDAIGNGYEWTSDMIMSNQGIVSTTDPTNDDLAGVDFTGLVGAAAAFNVLMTTFNYFNFPLGIPLQCSAVIPDPLPACDPDDLSYLTTSVSLFGDRYFRTSAVGPWGSLVGGLFADGSSAGRFRFAFDQGASTNFLSASPRCLAYVN